MRHTTFYNITSNVGTFCFGLVASMEKENSKNKDFDENSIVAIKTSLMGPLSGVGDSIFWGVLRVIAAAVAIPLSLKGSILGPIIFLLIYNVPSIICRYYLTYMGYSMGESFLSKIQDSGAMAILSKCASILGLMMIGGMTASMVKFNSILTFTVPNGDPVKLQTYLDSIFKGLVPLLLTYGCLKLMQKRVNINVIMFGVMGLAILLAILGIV
jgi:mannose PTS system EIID component